MVSISGISPWQKSSVRTRLHRSLSGHWLSLLFSSHAPLCYTTSAAATAVGKFVGGLRLPGIAKHSASTESVFAVTSGEAGSHGPGANNTTSVAATAVAKSFEEVWPLGIVKCNAATAATAVVTSVAKSVGFREARPPGVKYRAATESEFAESSVEFPDVVKSVGEARPPEIAKYRTTTAAKAVVPTVAESVGVGETRPPGFEKCSATSVSESEIAESSAEASSAGEDEAREMGDEVWCAVLVAAVHTTVPPDHRAMWDQYKAKFQKVYKEVDEKTLFVFFSVKRRDHSVEPSLTAERRG